MAPIVDGAEAGSVSSEESDAALVRGVWEAVLGMSGLSGAANFFSAGGDSLSAMQVIVRLRAAVIPRRRYQVVRGTDAGRVHSAGRGRTELITFILAFVSRS